MFDTFIHLGRHISRKRKQHFAALFVLMLVASIVELISLGAVVPFLAAMSAPEKVFHHRHMRAFVDLLAINGPEELLLPLALAFSLAAIASGSLRMLLLWVGTKLTFAAGADISFNIYERTLHQPYAVHVARNSSEVITGITLKSHSVIYGGIFPALQLTSSLLTLCAIVSGLVAVDPWVALGALFGFGFVYGLLIYAARRKLASNGRKISAETTKVLKCLQEGLGGIRDVLLDSSQATYCQSYKAADRPLRKAQGNNQFISASPRYAMEAIGMSLIAALAYYLVSQPQGMAHALPVLGVLALGAQRLLPALQQAYSAWATIRGNMPSIENVLDLLDQPMPQVNRDPNRRLDFNKSIRLCGVSFHYGPNLPNVLKDVDLSIVKGERLGIIGPTGSGKSTLMDILLGLLEPSAGTLKIDDVSISAENVSHWQLHIAHVPQSIYLSDSSIEENIAFGIPKDKIDRKRVREAAQLAHIAEMIESMPSGYKSLVGERGVRLSGGQRQRIGIARALYKQADVIVFDEATSALDNETERSVMDSIEELNDNLTVIIIAHRLTTLEKCHRVVELQDGALKRIGSYQEIIGDRGQARTEVRP